MSQQHCQHGNELWANGIPAVTSCGCRVTTPGEWLNQAPVGLPKGAPVALLEISPAGKLMVRVHQDGRLEYGEAYAPDDAARVLWNAVQCYAPHIGNPPLAGFTSEQLRDELVKRGVQFVAFGESIGNVGL